MNLAGLTGLEPATSALTGPHSNQLNYNPSRFLTVPSTYSTVNNGGVWESNPPGPVIRTRHGFEDRRAHQDPVASPFPQRRSRNALPSRAWKPKAYRTKLLNLP